MELRQLDYLVAVAEEANFTRAAERVHVSQSGVSAQIRQLEAELGLQLLDRSTRNVRPTSAGQAVLPFARTALAAVRGARRCADELAGLQQGRVAVGMVTACTVPGLFAALEAFHARYPGVEIALNEDSSDRLIDGVVSGRFDVALLGTAAALPTGIESQVVADEALVAAVPFEHPLGTALTIGLADLVGHPLIALPLGAGVRSAFDAACAAAGLKPHIGLEASAPDVVAGLAERGLGVAVLSQTMAAAHGATLTAALINDPPLRSRLELAWRRGDTASPAAMEFVAHARQAFADA